MCTIFSIDYNFISIYTHTFNFKIMCVCVSVCACKCRCLWSPDIAYEFSGTRDVASCELSDMVMGINHWVTMGMLGWVCDRDRTAQAC